MKKYYHLPLLFLRRALSPILNRVWKGVNFIPKRIRIVAATVAVTFFLMLTSFGSFSGNWYYILFFLVAGSYLTTYLAVFEDIDGAEWYMIFIIPILTIMTFYLFYFIIPVRWLTRLPLLSIFGLVYYAALLNGNIFNVGADKSLALYRAAFSVNYFLHSFLIFLFMLVVFSLKQLFIINGLFAGIVSFLLSIQLYWSIDPKPRFETNLLKYSLLTGSILFSLGVMLSFLPLQNNIAALIVSTVYYGISGILHHHLDGRLFPNIIREYVFVIIFVLLIGFLTLGWL